MLLICATIVAGIGIAARVTDGTMTSQGLVGARVFHSRRRSFPRFRVLNGFLPKNPLLSAEPVEWLLRLLGKAFPLRLTRS